MDNDVRNLVALQRYNSIGALSDRQQRAFWSLMLRFATVLAACRATRLASLQPDHVRHVSPRLPLWLALPSRRKSMHEPNRLSCCCNFDLPPWEDVWLHRNTEHNIAPSTLARDSTIGDPSLTKVCS